MEQIRFQGYARERGFNPVQVSNASVDAIAQQGNALSRQMQDVRQQERQNRGDFLQGMQNAQQLEAQNRRANFEFAQNARARYQDAVQQNMRQQVIDEQNKVQNLDRQLTVLGSLAGLSGTIAKTVTEWKTQKDENDRLQGYADYYANGGDPDEEARVQQGIIELKQADRVIQQTANNLEDTGAPPEAARAVRRVSKAYLLGQAQAKWENAAGIWTSYLSERKQADDQTQIRYIDPETNTEKIITPKSAKGPDELAAVHKVLLKSFIKEQGLDGINPAIAGPALRAMKQAENQILDQERKFYEKADNEDRRTRINYELDAGLNVDPVRAINDAITRTQDLRDDNGNRITPLAAANAILDRLVASGNRAAVEAFASSESYIKGVPWGEARKAEFKEAFRKLDSQQASDEDMKDRLSDQEFENFSDEVYKELLATPGGADQSVAQEVIDRSLEVFGKVDPRIQSYRENSTLQARTSQEQEEYIKQLLATDQLTLKMLTSGAYSYDLVKKYRGEAERADKLRTPEAVKERTSYAKAVSEQLLQVMGWTGGPKDATYHFAEAHALRQLDAKARTYLNSGKNPVEAYSLASQDIIKQIEKDNAKINQGFGTYSLRNGEFYRWGDAGSGGQGGLATAKTKVSSIISQIKNGGQAAVSRPLITKQQAESLVNPDAVIPEIIHVIQNALPKGKEMSEFEIIDAQLRAHGLPPRQRPLSQQRVEAVDNPRLRELLYRLPTAARTSRALTGSGVVGPGQERQAIGYIAQQLGVDPVDVATFINYETGGALVSGKYRRGLDVWGGDGGNYFGWIQFSPDNQRKYGVRPGMTAMQMAQAVTGYLKNAGIRPGDGLEMMYQAVQAPAYLGRARQLGRVIGADSNGSLTDHIKRMRAGHQSAASRWLSEGAQQTASAWRDPRLLSAPARRLLTQTPLTSGFGAQEGFRSNPHGGNDYGVPTGTKLSLKQAGQVIDVGSPNEYNGGYGGFVDIRLADGNVVRLAHLSKVKVQPGQKIGPKQIAALSGNTGRSTGPHVHIEHIASPGKKGRRDPSWIASQIYADI